MTNKVVNLDAHFHLDLYQNYKRILNTLDNENYIIIAVTNTPSVFHFTKNISLINANVLPAIGMHPELVNERYMELNVLLNQIPNEKYIGEVGLDYSKKYSSLDRKLQREIFEKILYKCSDVRNRVLSIHSRNATTDVIQMIGENFPGTVVLHWYSGNLRDLEKAIDFGYYFSVNPGMTRSKNGQRIISRIPQKRVLTETDGPFFKIENKPIEPQQVRIVIDYLSDIWKTEKQETGSIITNNIIEAGIIH